MTGQLPRRLGRGGARMGQVDSLDCPLRFTPVNHVSSITSVMEQLRSWHLGCTGWARGLPPYAVVTAEGVCNPARTPRREEANVAKEDRGFASMDRAKQREIASKGGKAAHQKGTAHEWTSEEARDAGRKGGIASHQRRREQLGGDDADDTGLTDSDTTRNASAESMRGYGSSESMRRSDSVSGSSSSSSSSSSMEDFRDDYARRDGWPPDE
jgi:general stress protein YciG